MGGTVRGARLVLQMPTSVLLAGDRDVLWCAGNMELCIVRDNKDVYSPVFCLGCLCLKSTKMTHNSFILWLHGAFSF